MPAINFTVSRTGDLTKNGSVDWTLEGTIAATDLATGQAKAGTLTWPANDATSRTIVINTVGNTQDQPDRTCQIRLGNPVNATLGVTTASTIIVDDDVPAVTDYIEDLPFGGTLLGAAIQDGTPGNIWVRNQSGKRENAMVVYLESRKPIVAIQTENRVDHYPLGTTPGGYSDRTVVNDGSGNRPAVNTDKATNIVVARALGGTLQWKVARVIGPAEGSMATLVLEKKADGSINWVGQTALIPNCARDKSWQAEWDKHPDNKGKVMPASAAASDPTGSYPTIWFDAPIDPVALGWRIGDRIAFCIFNTASPDTGGAGVNNGMAPPYGTSQNMSCNAAFRKNRPARKSTYRYHAYSGTWWYTFDQTDAGTSRYTPVMLIGHDAGAGKPLLVKGHAYNGGSPDQVDFGGSVRYRQILRVPNDSRWNGRTLVGADCTPWRTSSAGGSFTIAVARATPGKIGAPDDDGDMLGSTTYTDVLVGDNKNYAGTAEPHRNVTLPDSNFPKAVLTVNAGDAYYIILSASTSGYSIGRQLNWFGRAGGGLLKADHQNIADRFQSKSGTGSWGTVDNNGGNINSDYTYNILGVSLFLKA